MKQSDNYQDNMPYSVSGYVRFLNEILADSQAEITGEVSEVKIPASGHVYFTLKDPVNGDCLPCIIWKSKYFFCNVELEKGMEVLVKGHSNYYGPFGKLSFHANTVELVGEGALKKAYDKLKAKLEAEGLFDQSRKRAIPRFPKKIGVITSTHGAVVHDFNNNLLRCGFDVKIMNSRVEGAESGKDLFFAIRAFKERDIDVLVLIRGGGSMQSLAGFDNELLVREVANFPVPVITGIGHHQDIPLTALAADASQSTPSLVASLLSSPWAEAKMTLDNNQRKVLSTYENWIANTRYRINEEYAPLVFRGFIDNLKAKKKMLGHLHRLIEAHNPKRQLQLGFSIVRKKGRIVKKPTEVSAGDDIEIQMATGSLESNVKKVKG